MCKFVWLFFIHESIPYLINQSKRDFPKSCIVFCELCFCRSACALCCFRSSLAFWLLLIQFIDLSKSLFLSTQFDQPTCFFWTQACQQFTSLDSIIAIAISIINNDYRIYGKILILGFSKMVPFLMHNVNVLRILPTRNVQSHFWILF